MTSRSKKQKQKQAKRLARTKRVKRRQLSQVADSEGVINVRGFRPSTPKVALVAGKTVMVIPGEEGNKEE